MLPLFLLLKSFTKAKALSHPDNAYLSLALSKLEVWILPKESLTHCTIRIFACCKAIR